MATSERERHDEALTYLVVDQRMPRDATQNIFREYILNVRNVVKDFLTLQTFAEEQPLPPMLEEPTFPIQNQVSIARISWKPDSSVVSAPYRLANLVKLHRLVCEINPRFLHPDRDRFENNSSDSLLVGLNLVVNTYLEKHRRRSTSTTRILLLTPEAVRPSSVTTALFKKLMELRIRFFYCYVGLPCDDEQVCASVHSDLGELALAIRGWSNCSISRVQSDPYSLRKELSALIMRPKVLRLVFPNHEDELFCIGLAAMSPLPVLTPVSLCHCHLVPTNKPQDNLPRCSITGARMPNYDRFFGAQLGSFNFRRHLEQECRTEYSSLEVLYRIRCDTSALSPDLVLGYPTILSTGSSNLMESNDIVITDASRFFGFCKVMIEQECGFVVRQVCTTKRHGVILPRNDSSALLFEVACSEQYLPTSLLVIPPVQNTAESFDLEDIPMRDEYNPLMHSNGIHDRVEGILSICPGPPSPSGGRRRTGELEPVARRSVLISKEPPVPKKQTLRRQTLPDFHQYSCSELLVNKKTTIKNPTGLRYSLFDDLLGAV